MSTENMSRREAHIVVDATYEGAGRLVTCGEFQKKYPKEYRYLFGKILYDYGFTIYRADWDELESIEVMKGLKVAAWAYVEKRRIGVPGKSIDCFKCDLERSMAHELLHLAKMPNHAEPMKKTDDIPVLLDKCGFRPYW